MTLLETTWRSVRSAPLTSAAAVILIAVGVGANAAVFAVTWQLLVKPLPYAEPSRLAIVSLGPPAGGDFGVPLADFEQLRVRLRTTESVAAYTTSEAAFRGSGEPQMIDVAYVTDGFFDVLGVGPLRGQANAKGQGDLEAVISLRLSESSSIELGQSMAIADGSHATQAIMPRPFAFPAADIDVWLPQRAGAPAAGVRDTRTFRIIARMQPGVTADRLRDDVVRVMREIRYPTFGTTGSGQATATTLTDAIQGGTRPVLTASAVGSLLVLLVTCANVAMLLLGRAVGKRRESAVRLALGANRLRLVRESLAESFLLSALGAAGGLWIAIVGLQSFGSALVGVVSSSGEQSLAIPATLAASVFTIVIAILCGGAAAWQRGRGDCAAALRSGPGPQPRSRRLMTALVALQIAASIVLLTGTVLLWRTVNRLLAEDPGVDGRQALTLRLPLSALGADLARSGRSIAVAGPFRHRRSSRMVDGTRMSRIKLPLPNAKRICGDSRPVERIRKGIRVRVNLQTLRGLGGPSLSLGLQAQTIVADGGRDADVADQAPLAQRKKDLRRFRPVETIRKEIRVRVNLQDAAVRAAFVDRVLEQIRALPGVTAAGVGSSLPPRAAPFQIYIRFATPSRNDGLRMSVVSATDGYLEAIGARVVSGRVFDRADTLPGPVSRVLLSESAARFASPESPDLSGRELPIRLPPVAVFSGRPLVAGVIRDVKYAGLDLPAAAAVYLPWTLRPTATAHLAVRTTADPMLAAPAIRRVLKDSDPRFPIGEFRSLDDEIARSVLDRRLRVVPALGLAAVALIVAAVGVFASLARAAAEGRREFAIRLALGASRRRVVGMMLGRAATMAVFGILMGLLGNALVAGGLRSLLYGVTPQDPLTVFAVVTVVGAAAIGAALVPARHASRADPMELLRAD